MSRERILGAIEALEELAEWFDLMQHGMNGSGFHQGIAAAAAKCRQEAGEWRVKLAALPPEPEPWTPRERMLRERLEAAANRIESIIETEPHLHLKDDLAFYRRALTDTPPPEPRDAAMERAETSLITARAAFRFYAEHHAQKGDRTRSEQNAAYADEMDRGIAAIRAARGTK